MWNLHHELQVDIDLEGSGRDIFESFVTGFFWRD
jgi:hypothetical protein